MNQTLSIKNSFRHILLFVFLLGCVQNTIAQIGFNTSYSKPLGDFGASFGKAASFELFYTQTSDDGKIIGRVGFFHAEYKPRLDTFPVFLVQYDNGYKIYPGSLVYSNHKETSFFIEYNFRIWRYKKVDFFIGGGAVVGIVKNVYKADYTPILTQSVNNEDYIAGLRVRASVSYDINAHFSVLANILYQQETLTDWSSKYPTKNIGIGLVYNIMKQEKEED